MRLSGDWSCDNLVKKIAGQLTDIMDHLFRFYKTTGNEIIVTVPCS